MRGRRFVLGGRETGNPLLQRRKLDDDEAMEGLRSFHDLVASPACQDLPAVAGDDVRDEIGVLLVLDWIRNPRSSNPICSHTHARISHARMKERIMATWRSIAVGGGATLVTAAMVVALHSA